MRALAAASAERTSWSEEVSLGEEGLMLSTAIRRAV